MTVQITAPSGTLVDGAVRLEPRPFRPMRDGAIAVAFVAVIATCVVAAMVWGHAAAVLGIVYASMAFLVWIEAFRSSWAVGPDVLSARRWAIWRTFHAADVTTVAVDPGEPGIDVSVGGRGAGRVVVPLDDWRRRPGAVGQLREFLANAQSAGATIDPMVWRALDRG